jgi:glycosyltransferase involved in cell wall biosynthesis
VIAGLFTHTGGPATTVPGLCEGLARRGHAVTLLTGEGDLAESVQALRSTATVVTAPLGPYGLANFSTRFAKAARTLAAATDVVHVHGVWLHPNWVAVAAGLAEEKPVVRSPRGMLSAWTFRRSSLAKRLVWLTRERRLFARTQLIHATSEQEAAEIRSLQLSNPVAVIPNGLDLRAEYSSDRVAAIAATGWPPGQGPRRVLFLSRLHPKKGLELLLSVWRGLPSDLPAELVIAGTAAPSAAEALAQRLASLPGPRVTFLGAVRGEEKIRLLASSWVLVLPSWNENYGMVVAEALAAGTPVIATRGTPWRQLSARQCGWWIDHTEDSLRETLLSALAIGEEQRLAMSRRGRHLIEQEHSIDAATERMETAYAWVAGAQQIRPDWILH